MRGYNKEHDAEVLTVIGLQKTFVYYKSAPREDRHVVQTEYQGSKCYPESRP